MNSLADVVDLLDVGRDDVLGLLEERLHDGGAACQLARDAGNTCNISKYAVMQTTQILPQITDCINHVALAHVSTFPFLPPRSFPRARGLLKSC